MEDPEIHLKNPINWDDATCALFVTWLLSNKGKNKKPLKAVSARSYLYGAKDLLRAVGGSAVKETPVANKILKGHRRLKPCQEKVRKPITLDLLTRILRQLNWVCDHDSLVLATLFSVAFFGLLRLGDLTHPYNVLTSDIKFFPSLEQPEFVRIFLHKTKTSQFDGHTVILGRTTYDFCPVLLLRFIFQTYKPNNSSHFFCLSDKSQLHAALAVTCMRELVGNIGLNPMHYSGHSFRKGGGQQAANVKFPLHHIQELGSWKSQSFRLYFENTEQRKAFTAKLADSRLVSFKKPSKIRQQQAESAKDTPPNMIVRSTVSRNHRHHF